MKKRKFQRIAVLWLASILLFTGCGRNADGTDADNSADAGVNAESNLSDAYKSDESGEANASADANAFTDEGQVADALEQTAAEEDAAGEVTLIMVGDMLLHDGLEEYALQEDGTYDYSSFFANTKDLIADADIAIANQEVILGGEELGITGYPSFNGPYAFGDQLVDVGFDVILHGTNHALDRGATGISNCLDFWETNYPEEEVLGINENEEQYETVHIIEKNDIRIAILNYTYSTNGIELPYYYSVDMLDEDKVISDIAYAEENADVTVVCPHWGTEYSLEESSYQEYWTDIFLENGVDLVIGTHPHVIEPIEWVEDEETGHKMLVYYSLGNFINWTAGSGAGTADRMVGGMACVTFAKEEDGSVEISDDSVIPLICHLSNTPGLLTVYPYSEYTEELGEENEIRSQDSNFSYDYCTDLIDEVWGDYENVVR